MCLRIIAILAANDLDKAREFYRTDAGPGPAAPAADARRGTIAQMTSRPHVARHLELAPRRRGDADASPVLEQKGAR